MKKHTLLTFALVALPLFVTLLAQPEDDLLSLIGEPEAAQNFTAATFKGTRLINFHTVEVPGRRTLDFRIAHRFGSFNSGWYDFFGLDGGASIRLGLEYSYDGRLMFGLGRTSIEKTFDAFAKYRLLRQEDGGGMPLSLTVFGSAYYINQRDPNKTANGFDKYERRSSRMAYVWQAIVGRKFNDRFSLQVAPVFVHVNLAEEFTDKNDAVLLTAAARYKFSQRTALTMEYGWRATDYSRTRYYDSFGVGVDIDTGGHVFQVHLTNSLGLADNQFYTRTNTKWGDAGIRLGFNISRVFTI